MPKGVYKRRRNPIENMKPRAVRPTEDRFWEKVDKDGPVVSVELGPCWVWTAALDGKGYGKIQVKRGDAHRVVSAHRLAWEIAEGRSPQRQVLHRCDNKACVRRDHLFLGDHADNMADKVSKGRQLRGEGIPRSKLTEAQVREIRDLHDRGLLNQAGAARAFGVSGAAISDVVRGRTWRHVT